MSDSKSASIENPLAAFDSWHNNISPGESINTGLKESYSSNPSPSIKKIVPVSTVKIIEDHQVLDRVIAQGSQAPFTSSLLMQSPILTDRGQWSPQNEDVYITP